MVIHNNNRNSQKMLLLVLCFNTEIHSYVERGERKTLLINTTIVSVNTAVNNSLINALI